MKRINVLSLFDGLACGMLAFQKAGIAVDSYYAYEIDKYAIQTATHNFPQIQECGDVFKGDYTQYEGIDYLIGGSPCTYWSIAQSPDKRETTASGIGWELFSQYVRALHEANPKYFIYENNKSMSKEIRKAITEAFGIERHQRNMVVEPVNVTADGKAQCLRATCYKDGVRNIAGNDIDKKTGVAEPVCVASRGRYSDTDIRTNKTDAPTYQHYEARTDGKTNAITTVSKDNLVGEPLRVGIYPTSDGRLLDSQGMRIYSVDAKSVTQSAQGGGIGAKTGLYAIPIEFDGDIPIKAVSGADGKAYTVYEVKDGTITIKGKTYPIKLVDGYYIIRKLTVSECKRLQTVPEWYEFPVSNTQSYKMLGNGWTIDVIVHLIEATSNFWR